jgi:hypothetical protein
MALAKSESEDEEEQEAVGRETTTKEEGRRATGSIGKNKTNR